MEIFCACCRRLPTRPEIFRLMTGEDSFPKLASAPWEQHKT
jgi:hypothetical protein